uniref:Uncharacterized protein n=1 Tax=Triticum urartu TaxID=4572 RepID=A0A8R7QIC6_TRIUA
MARGQLTRTWQPCPPPGPAWRSLSRRAAESRARRPGAPAVARCLPALAPPRPCWAAAQGPRAGSTARGARRARLQPRSPAPPASGRRGPGISLARGAPARPSGSNRRRHRWCRRSSSTTSSCCYDRTGTERPSGRRCRRPRRRRCWLAPARRGSSSRAPARAAPCRSCTRPRGPRSARC